MNEQATVFGRQHRRRLPRAGRTLVRWWMAVPALLLTAACSKAPSDVFTGYAEGEYIRLPAPLAGTVVKVYANRGDAVALAAPAFVLEQESERAAREEARFRVLRAESALDNLKLGKRVDELAAIRAQLAQAQAALALSTSELARAAKLVSDNFTSAASLDQVRAGVARDQGRVNELNAQLRVAMLGARVNEVAGAEQEVKAAQAQLQQAQWRVEQKTQRMPVAGDVVDVLVREGEWVPAGGTVLTLLPPGNIKARFFVPQALVGSLALGQGVSLACDGCGAPFEARISFIAREAEYTAPIIYSQQNRANLVFMVEARPAMADARRLHPGQPLEVRLSAAAPRQGP